MRRWLIVVAYLLSMSISASAQEEPEYRMEVGGALGVVSYEGDFNGNITKNAQPLVALVAKYRMNPRMSLGGSLTTGKLKGSSKDVDSYFPELHDSVYSFSNQLIDLGLRYEYNFWAYGTGREYRGARPLTPFIALGLGAIYHGGAEKGLAVNLPFGAGVKYKLGNRLNLTAEWRMHFSMSDKLDGVEDPYGIKSTGIFKNTDCFSILQVALTYDFWAKCKTCHNDRD